MEGKFSCRRVFPFSCAVFIRYLGKCKVHLSQRKSRGRRSLAYHSWRRRNGALPFPLRYRNLLKKEFQTGDTHCA